MTGRYNVNAETEVWLNACQIQIINVRTEYGPAPGMLLACNARADKRDVKFGKITRGMGEIIATTTKSQVYACLTLHLPNCG